MADNDVQIEQKKRSRRRLVGAVALALFAAIVLPMVMDSEPKPAGGELQIRIPGQEGSNFARRMIAGNAPPPTSPALPAGQSVPLVPVSSPAQPAPSDVPVNAESAVAAAASSASPRTQEEKPAVTQSSSSRASTKSSASEHSKPSSNESERVREILAGKDKPDPKDRADSRDKESSSSRDSGAQKLYVQLGVFRDEANAREVLARATAAGVKAVAIKAEDKTRLRAGPFSDRDAADAAVAKLKKADLNGIVVGK